MLQSKNKDAENSFFAIIYLECCSCSEFYVKA